MKILVTGGAGFIGSAIVKELVASGVEVRVIDKVRGSLDELKSPGLEIIEGGIEDKATVQKVTRDIDVIYHLAETFSSKPYEVVDIDVKGNINLLAAAVENNVKHFLFASTHRVYGRPRYLPVDENHPLNPEESGRALYAIFKIANEKLCRHYWQEHGLPVTIFRFWWSFSQNIGGKALRNAIDTALKGDIIRVPGQAGGNFLHNDDAIRAFQLATLNQNAYGEVFNISSGELITWQQLVEFACQLTDSSSKIEVTPPQDWHGDASIGTDRSIPYECNLDISKARKLIGFEPKYSTPELESLLKEAISELVKTRKKN